MEMVIKAGAVIGAASLGLNALQYVRGRRKADEERSRELRQESREALAESERDKLVVLLEQYWEDVGRPDGWATIGLGTKAQLAGGRLLATEFPEDVEVTARRELRVQLAHLFLDVPREFWQPSSSPYRFG